jgi:hypothetical protein
MRTETMTRLALTVAAMSLIGNYLQFLNVRAHTRAHEMQITRLQIEHRMRAMRDRADAFYALVLGEGDSAPHSDRSGMDADEYQIEYAVRVPEQKEQEFIEWMAAEQKTPLTVSARGYGHESAYRIVKDNGRDAGELYEKFSIAP